MVHHDASSLNSDGNDAESRVACTYMSTIAVVMALNNGCLHPLATVLTTHSKASSILIP